MWPCHRSPTENTLHAEGAETCQGCIEKHILWNGNTRLLGHDHALLNAGNCLVIELRSRSRIAELPSLHSMLPISTASQELLVQHA